MHSLRSDSRAYSSVPRSTNTTLVFPLDLNKLSYTTDSFSTIIVDGRVTLNEINGMFAEITTDCNRFKSFKIIRCLHRLSTGIVILLLTISIILIAAGFSTGGSNSASYTGIVILFFCVFGFILFQFLLTVCGLRNILRDYVDKANIVLARHRREYEVRGLRWRLGSQGVTWIELWLDYKLTEIHNGPNSNAVMLQEVVLYPQMNDKIVASYPVKPNYEYVELPLGSPLTNFDVTIMGGAKIEEVDSPFMKIPAKSPLSGKFEIINGLSPKTEDEVPIISPN